MRGRSQTRPRSLSPEKRVGTGERKENWGLIAAREGIDAGPMIWIISQTAGSSAGAGGIEGPVWIEGPYGSSWVTERA
jgi:hypothetical protein